MYGVVLSVKVSIPFKSLLVEIDLIMLIEALVTQGEISLLFLKYTPAGGNIETGLQSCILP